MLDEKRLEEYQAKLTELFKKLPEGPWTSEPHRVEFKHAGLDCLMNRNHMGAWCGYVAVKPGHPLYEKHYDEANVDVHGGLTYGRACGDIICHKTEGEDVAYWFGFDCAHMGDIVPGMLTPEMRNLGITSFTGSSAWPETYKNMSFVRDEVEKLAEQLAKVA